MKRKYAMMYSGIPKVSCFVTCVVKALFNDGVA